MRRYRDYYWNRARGIFTSSLSCMREIFLSIDQTKCYELDRVEDMNGNRGKNLLMRG